MPKNTMVAKNKKSQILGKGRIAKAFGKMLKHIYGPESVI